jgi:serine/threonine-protein kinase
MILENKLVSLDDLHTCVNRQQKLKKKGKETVPLSTVLMEKGLLTGEQLEHLAGMAEISEKPKHKAVGSYIIESKLGRGGMGAVFLARSKLTGEQVALKILPPITAENEDYRERFLREARVSLKMRHPNIIEGKKLGNMKGIYYYVMEYVPGESLADVLDEREYLSEAESLQVAVQIARALEYASGFDIIHRDIKPENILITPEGVVKLIDLGLAKPASGGATVTRSGLTLGTPHYISPEQIRGDMQLDIRSDIYSLGITLFEMVTGKPPFDGDSAGVVISKQIHEPIPPLSSLRPDCSTELERIVGKMTEKDRDERYNKPAVLVRDLENLLEFYSKENP